jgi:hypothetical protein
MTDNKWTLVGGCYAIFALASYMAAVSPCDQVYATRPQVVEASVEITGVYSQRLDNPDTRADYWITIWTTNNCGACERQKALVPAFEAAGYHVVIRHTPGGRWIKSFPALIITKDKPSGEALHTLNGLHTLEQIDETLKIGEGQEIEEDEVEDPDYDIFHPLYTEPNLPDFDSFWKPEWYKIYVWKKSAQNPVLGLELDKLRQIGFTVELVDGPGGFHPIAVLFDVRKPDSRFIEDYWMLFTADDVVKKISDLHGPH